MIGLITLLVFTGLKNNNCSLNQVLFVICVWFTLRYFCVL